MPVKLSSLKADLDREKKGDWIAFPGWHGVRFKVSALSLPAYDAARDLLLQRLQAEFKGQKVSQEILNPRLGELFAVHILHDWEGFDEPYSPQVALKYLTDPSYRELVDAVQWCANKLTEISPVYTDAEVKNSGKRSEPT